MEEPRSETALAVSVCVKATVAGRFESVNGLETALMNATHEAARQFYAQAFAAYQSAWLQARSGRFMAQRWRTVDWLTPFGRVALPVRVVREKASGNYFSLSKVLWGHKATRLLSPRLEDHAVAQAIAQNYRPAARSLSGWVGSRVSHWLAWACVQFHGARRVLELEKLSAPPQPRMKVPALVSEVDSTWLKAQRRNRPAVSVRHFPVHLGLHYTGRARRWAARGSKSARLENKVLLASSAPLARFGRTFELAAHQRFCPAHHIVLSDGDEGLEWMRQKHFAQATWLLDRWHIGQAEHRRIMAAVWQADSEKVLQALKESPLRHRRPTEFRKLFGYVLGNREGIDAWKQVPAPLRRSVGRHAAAVKCGSGAVEKNIEVTLNRRFKRQGRSWNRQRAQYLLQLQLLYADQPRWLNWWKEKPKFKPKPNPP